jgi:hypothetical protein
MIVHGELTSDGRVIMKSGHGPEQVLESAARCAVLEAVKNLANLLAEMTRPLKIQHKESVRREARELMVELTALCRAAGLHRKPEPPLAPEEIVGSPAWRRLHGSPEYVSALVAETHPPTTHFRRKNQHKTAPAPPASPEAARAKE